MQRQNQSYTVEFKQRAVELSSTRQSIVQASRELGTSAENIRRWKNHFENGRLGNRTKQTTESKLLQLKKLKRELEKVTIERDILKKAANILSSDTQLSLNSLNSTEIAIPLIKSVKYSASAKVVITIGTTENHQKGRCTILP